MRSVQGIADVDSGPCSQKRFPGASPLAVSQSQPEGCGWPTGPCPGMTAWVNSGPISGRQSEPGADRWSEAEHEH